jgi:hypothetical protein
VKRIRTVFSAFALVVALVAVAAVPAYAGQVRPGCAPVVKGMHDCCKTPVLKACCSDRSERSNQGAPAQSRVQVSPNFVATPATFVVDLSSAVRPIGRLQSAPLRAGPLDLPTFLSTLLI